jgi:N-acetylmuramoyl-L-alanine amidase/Bacterial Ig domain
MRRAAAAVAAFFALAATAAAATDLPGVRFVAASPRNYAHTHRAAAAIRMVVVHDIEGSAAGAISWFRNPRARASANFVVSRDGEVTQMVPTWATAWHAGNGYVNAHSLGIEHEGYVNVKGIYTDAEYRASAKLVAQLARTYRIPLDRTHVIGHNQVPDPNHPWLKGGFAHHKDPGKFWDWTRYMSYVRAYLAGTPPPPLAFDVTLPDIAMGARLSGIVDVAPLVAGEDAARIDVLVDGVVRAPLTDEPLDLAWDTTEETNGRHILSVHAVAAGGRTADAAVVVLISNPPQPPTVVIDTLAEGQTVSGVVRWETSVTGKVTRVDFLLDGMLVDSEFGPWGFDWDTTQEAPGPHKLTVQAIRPDGKVGAAQTINVIVAPPESEPAPEPTPEPAPAP